MGIDFDRVGVSGGDEGGLHLRCSIRTMPVWSSLAFKDETEIAKPSARCKLGLGGILTEVLHSWETSRAVRILGKMAKYSDCLRRHGRDLGY